MDLKNEKTFFEMRVIESQNGGSVARIEPLWASHCATNITAKGVEA